jgi:PAS domain S-box-containing protein
MICLRRSARAREGGVAEDTSKVILDLLPVGVFVVDDQGTPVYANQEAVRLLGRGADPAVPVERLAEAFEAYVSGTDERYPLERMPVVRALAGESTCVDDLEIRRPDGNVVLQVNGRPVPDGDGSVRYGVVTFTDVSGAEPFEALRRRERQLAEAQAIAHIGSWTWDIGPDVVSWSDELFRIHGLEPQSVAIDYAFVRAGTHPDDRARFEAMVGNAYVTGEPFSARHRILRPDGEVRWVRSLGRVTMGEKGPIRMAGTREDITARKQAEDDLVRSLAEARRLAEENAVLHAQVQQQLDEVRASRARLVEVADAERRRLERDLHDGAQARIVTISLMVGLAVDQLAGVDRQAAEGLREVGTEVQLALAELRELARGLHPSILTQAGLGPALDGLARRAAVPTTVVATPGRRLDPAVERAAYFVASEALTNAIKHAEASRATISAVVAGSAIVVEVADDGVGGADPSLGSGLLGLADRVGAFDGRLTIDSPAGGGTRIVAEIPCG